MDRSILEWLLEEETPEVRLRTLKEYMKLPNNHESFIQLLFAGTGHAGCSRHTAIRFRGKRISFLRFLPDKALSSHNDPR